MPTESVRASMSPRRDPRIDDYPIVIGKSLLWSYTARCFLIRSSERSATAPSAAIAPFSMM